MLAEQFHAAAYYIVQADADAVGDLDVRGRGGFTAALTRPGLEVAG
jgi:hypothetical protein